jgi:hypothetical protein
MTASVKLGGHVGVYLAALALATGATHADNAATSESRAFISAFESIQSSDLKKHAAYLADDTFEGREAGSRGGRAAGVYLGQELRRHELAGGGTSGSYYQAFGASFRNVLGLLEGSDPRLKDEVIVVSAHYDHVGYGAADNSRGPIGYIHNGADDNGSGTAGLLEVIEAFTRLESRPKRTLLFAFWDAEEKGLLGSKHWIAEPTLSLRRVRALVNMDMIGRLQQRRLEISGVRTAAGWQELVARQNEGLDLRLDFSWEIKPNSDHYPFFARGIPYLMLHTGLHADYHRPSDDADKLAIDGMQAVSRLCFRLVSELANRPSVPSFRDRSRVETALMQRQVERPSPPLPSRLGVSWAAKGKDEEGIVVSVVSAGSAAAKAGVMPGDRIVKFDGHVLRADGEFQSYILSVEKALAITITRSGQTQPIELQVELDGEPVRVGIVWRSDDAEPGAAILTRVVPASPAARAGLQVNDRIYAISGRRFDPSEQLLGLLNESQGVTELEVVHQGELYTRKLDLPPLRTPDPAPSGSTSSPGQPKKN